jgi:LacI family transcriptional regulator, repressor for deo operon, udp, cdd, tsx, nupC, and nupG
MIMTTINDVAHLAKVSTATVSRVLHDTGNVKQATRNRVLKAVEALDYQPNILARQFRRKETRSIVVVFPDITSPFYSKVLLGIEDVAHRYNYQVLLGDSRNDPEREYQYLDLLKQKQVDGMILLTSRIGQADMAEIASQFPIVLAGDYIEGLQVPTVSIDNISGARKITDHLISLGHERMAFFSGPMDRNFSKDRWKGFRQALANHDLQVYEGYILEGNYTIDSGYALLLRILDLDPRPTAVFASNDQMAVGAIKAAQDMGLRVPEDLAIVGFDDIDMASICEPELTTIAQPKHGIGEQAMELLIQQMMNIPLAKPHVLLDGKLIIRESCGKRL